jgi:hypothetical protein
MVRNSTLFLTVNIYTSFFLSCKIEEKPIPFIQYMWFTIIHIKVYNTHIVFQLNKSFVDARVYPEYVQLIRCDIKLVSVKRSIDLAYILNKYNVQLYICRCNVLIKLQLNKYIGRCSSSFWTWFTNPMPHLTEISWEI